MNVNVQNFQSLRDVTLDVTGLTVIVGPSNRGKSALLRAIEAALFNRPGDEFVSAGEKTATVALGAAPTADGAVLGVVWSKGGGQNAFVVNGQAYSKVGTGAPQPLQEAGYRDVWIGDKDRKKGETIRPQVANQFDGLFLLPRTGSFIADVLGLLSRQRTVAMAQGRAVADLRSTKQVLGIRESDLQAVAVELAAFEGLDPSLTRVHALGNRLQLLTSGVEQWQRMGELQARRKALQPALALVLPPSAFRPEVWDAGERLAALRGLQARRLSVAFAGRLQLPEPSKVHWSMFEKVQLRTLRTLRAQRPKAVPAMPRPTPPMVLTHIGPKPVAVVPAQIRDFLTTLRQFASTRRQLLDASFALKGQVTNLTVEQEEAEGRLAALKAELKVCPTCGKPA